MHALDILGDPVRRRILELLATGERSSGELAAVIAEEFGISHPGVSQHLKVLRDNGFASVRAEGTRRVYAVEPGPLEELDAWVAQFRAFWGQRLDALGTELRRGRPTARVAAPAPITRGPARHAPSTTARTTPARTTPAPTTPAPTTAAPTTAAPGPPQHAPPRTDPTRPAIRGPVRPVADKEKP